MCVLQLSTSQKYLEVIKKKKKKRNGSHKNIVQYTGSRIMFMKLTEKKNHLSVRRPKPFLFSLDVKIKISTEFSFFTFRF